MMTGGWTIDDMDDKIAAVTADKVRCKVFSAVEFIEAETLPTVALDGWRTVDF